MAVSSKGGSGGGGRGRPYGVMLLLAFGAAVLGVMVLHKLRERRIFTLLIQDKDNDLMNLHLLLQREKGIGKEMKRKIEDLKVKANFLKAQKTELSNKFANIQSVTSSLREEVTALEFAVEEKQNEIKMLKEKETNSSLGNSQVSALMEILKQKETEIEEMKRMVEKSTLSVTTDDPSNPIVKTRVLGTNLEDGKGSIGNSSDSTVTANSLVQLVNSTNLEDGKIVGEGVADKTEVQGEQIGKLETADKVNNSNGGGENGNNAEGVNVEESKHVLKLKRSRMIGGSKGTRGGGRRKIIGREIGSSGNGEGGGVEAGESGVLRRKGARTVVRGETSNLRVDEVSEKLGERNGELLEHSKYEGLRSNSKESNSGEVRGRDQEVSFNENSNRNASSDEREGVNEGDDFSYDENQLKKAQNGVSSSEDSTTTTTGDATKVPIQVVETNATDSNSNRSAADNMEKKEDVEQERIGVTEDGKEE